MDGPSGVIAARGGSFLIEDRKPEEVFTPEDFSDEQRMMGRTCADWMEGDVAPKLDQILALNYETTRQLMRKAGDLGLLSIEIPEEYGGLGLDKVSATVAAENSARDGSFVVTYMAHTGIGTLPIVYFGTEAQKKKYLPKLGSGEWIASYSLSEASSASDAMNAKTRAVASADGKSWILNGEKMWLTNAGFADVYTTFAKVDGEHFTAFIIEKGMPGVSLGPEEKKTGIKGSSTRPLILSDAVVPKENVLGEIGKGHKIAFNVLNIGRFKLGAGVTGGAKLAIGQVVEYAKGRLAFGHPISDFGLIRQKLGEMSIRAFASESMVYRTAGMIDRNLADVDGKDSEACLKRIEEYDVECSMVKVWCSEMLDYVVDEAVQIYGGAGFVEDYPAERHWRDARINRIFEGTNEINRLLVPGRLLRRAMKGELPVFQKAMALMEEVAVGQPAVEPASGFLAAEAQMVAGAKKAALMCLGLAAQHFGQKLADEQEILSHFADIAMETYALESALLRTQKRAAVAGAGVDSARLQEAAVRCFAQDAMDNIDVSARRLLAAVFEGEKLRPYLEALQRFTRRQTVNTVALRRQVAAATIELGKYPLG
ncbi:MAG TPA: acyl-CoA dehydrogenase family protein [Polyangia bacterium]|jgi:alkylation response protein AidB-like acyl-CoA dehydrogenase|nr:acyl-CoA dehydrogenase family protein [Polyangia bacterium]